MKKEDLDADPQSMDNRRLSVIARNPNHPMHTHAKAELERRRMKTNEGAMKRIATTQASKTDRMASTDKKGLETFKKKPTSETKDAFGRLGITSPTMKHIDKKLDKVTQRTQTVMNKRPRSTMEEKTLTPAELKKREKIAKAIERDTPDMPMDKKMAIATATAKRVAEGSYERSTYGKGHVYDRGEAHEDAARHHDMEAEKHEKARNFETADLHTAASKAHQKAADYFSRLHSKREKGGGTGIVSTVSSRAAHDASQKANSFKEDTDLAELKKSTLANYIKKASDDRAKNAYDIGKSGKINYKGLKRRQGINRAVNKMANEEAMIKELDKKTLGSYIKKAGPDREKQKAQAARHSDAGDMADKDRDMYKHYGKAQRAMDKAANRSKYIGKAVDKLTKEATIPDGQTAMTRVAKVSDADKEKLIKIRKMLDKEKKK